MKLLQFTNVDQPGTPIAINPACVAWFCGYYYPHEDDHPRGTIIHFLAGSSVAVAESYESVLDALQSVEVGP